MLHLPWAGMLNEPSETEMHRILQIFSDVWALVCSQVFTDVWRKGGNFTDIAGTTACTRKLTHNAWSKPTRERFFHTYLFTYRCSSPFAGEGYVIRWAYFVLADRIVKDRKSRCRSTVAGRVRCAYFFWQGNDCSVNEKGAAAIMAVELDEEKGPQVCVSYFNYLFYKSRWLVWIQLKWVCVSAVLYCMPTYSPGETFQIIKITEILHLHGVCLFSLVDRCG